MITISMFLLACVGAAGFSLGVALMGIFWLMNKERPRE